MQSFGEYLKKYFDENSLSYKSVEKKCGIDRTILAKYAKGIMKPKNQKIVLRIVNGIEMPKQKAEVLCQIYKKEMICEKYGLNQELIQEFFEIKYVPLNQESDVKQKNRIFCEQEYADNLSTYQDMICAMQYLLEDASFIKMRIRPECKKMQEILQEDFFYKNDCSIEQIIVFQKDCMIEEKLKNFNSMFSCLVHMKDGNVYYQYSANHGETCYGWLPDYIMTNKGILFFDCNLEQGFFSNQQLSCAFYKEMFDVQKAECRIFATAGKKSYMEWDNQNMDCTIINEKTGICFSYSTEDKIWVSVSGEKQMVCIRELELVQLLKEML